jgi:hypothetical protein
MNRFIVFKDANGNSVPHGTLLFCHSERVFITSNPLDPAMGTRFFVSQTGLRADAQEVTEIAEIPVPAPGVAEVSIAPYVYKLKLRD